MTAAAADFSARTGEVARTAQLRLQVIQSFLADPTRPPDTSCIAGMAPIDFAHPPAEWLKLVGIDDLWENPLRRGQ